MKYKDYLIITFIIFILALFQTSFFAEVFGNSLNPNLILVLVFAFLFMDKTQEALFSTFVGGLLLDTLGNSIMGLSSLLLVCAVLLTLFAKKFVQESKYFQGILLLGSYLVYAVVINLNNPVITFKLFIGAFLTLLLAYVSYVFMKNLGNESKYL